MSHLEETLAITQANPLPGGEVDPVKKSFGDRSWSRKQEPVAIDLPHITLSFVVQAALADSFNKKWALEEIPLTLTSAFWDSRKIRAIFHMAL